MRSKLTPARRSTILSLFSLIWMTTPSVVSASAPTTADTDARLLGEHIAEGEAATAAVASGSLEEPQARVLTAFRGYLSWLSAYEIDGDPSRLCSARDLLVSVFDDNEDIDARVRTDAETRLAELDALLSERHASTTCALDADAKDVPSDRSPTVGPRPTQETSHHADDAPTVTRTPTEDLLADDSRGSARVASAAAATVTRAHAPTEDLLADDDPRPPVTAPVQRLRIAGGLSLGLGTSLLGVVTYGLLVDARAAAQIREIRLKEAGELTTSEWARSQKIGETGQAGARLATIAGIGSGVSLVTGAALLLFARRHKHARDDKPTLSFHPTASAGQAHLTLRGRF